MTILCPDANNQFTISIFNITLNYCEMMSQRSTPRFVVYALNSFLKAIRPPIKCPCQQGLYVVSNFTLPDVTLPRGLPLSKMKLRSVTKIFFKEGKRLTYIGSALFEGILSEKSKKIKKNNNRREFQFG